MQFGKAFDKKELKHLQKNIVHIKPSLLKNNILNHYNKLHNIIEI